MRRARASAARAGLPALAAFAVAAALALPAAAQVTAPPRVESVRFAVAPEPGDATVSFAVAARDDFGVEAVRLSVLAVRVADLLAGGEADAVARVATALAPDAEALAARGLALLDVSDLAADPAGDGVRFAAELPLPAALPPDAVFLVRAVATDAEGTDSPALAEVLTVDASGPADLALSLELLPSLAGVVLGVGVASDASDLRAVELSAALVSARALRAGAGRLADVPNLLLDPERRVRVDDGAPVRLTESFRLLPGEPLPADGVTVVEAVAVDTSGNRAAASRVFLLDRQVEAELVALETEPPRLVLGSVGQGPVLRALGVLADGTRIDLTGGLAGTSYLSADEDVVQVEPDGGTTAFFEGTTTITVASRGLSVEVPVTVDYFSLPTALRLAPQGLVLPRVGAQAQLTVTATLSVDPGVLEDDPDAAPPPELDLTDGINGTTYASSDPAIVTVDAGGRVTATGIGVATVAARSLLDPGLEALLDVEVLDGPPVVEIAVEPLSVRAGTSFRVIAQASDDTGPAGVERVRFLVDGRLVAEDDAAPYETLIQAPENGAGLALRVRAVALDRGGQQAESAERVVTVTAPPDTAAPSLGIVSPQLDDPLDPGERFQAFEPSPLRVTEGASVAVAVDAPQEVAEVEFVVDGSVIGADTTPREILAESDNGIRTVYENVFEARFQAPEVSSAGRSFAVTARGFDAAGNAGVADAVILRVVDDQPPVVSLDSPRDGEGVPAGEPLEVAGGVFDDLLTVGVSVRLLVSDDPIVDDADVLFATTVSQPLPFGLEVSEGGAGVRTVGGGNRVSASFAVPAEPVGAEYFAVIEATDSRGQTRRSNLVRFVAVGEQPPAVEILSPVNGDEVLEGDELLVSARARDDRAVARVDFLVDGEPFLSVFDPPYEVPLRIPTGRAGTALELSAFAVDDAGNETPAAERPVAVLGVVADSTPPTVSFADPAPLSSQPDSQELVISLSGRDDVRVAHVAVEIDGAPRFERDAPGVVSELTNGFFTTFVLPADELAAGTTLRLVAEARDAAGNTTRTEPLLVDVVGDGPPEIRSFTSSAGAAGAVVVGSSLDLFVDAVDDVGVREVVISRAGEDDRVDDLSPFRVRLDAPAVPGPLAFTAVAIDTRGQASAPASLEVEVLADTTAPQLSILDPRDGATLFGGERRAFVASGQDDVGVERVAFELRDGATVLQRFEVADSVLDGQVFQRFTSPPFELGPALVGAALTVRATARDAAGNETVETVAIEVVEDRPPAVAITFPAPGDAFVEGRFVTLTASASDDVGVVRAVPLVGDVLQEELAIAAGGGIDTSQPLSFVVPAPIRPEQAASFGVEVTDTRGQRTRASVPLEIVDDPNPPTAAISSPSTGLRVFENDSFHVVVETEDDLRTDAVTVLVNGEAVETLVEPFEGPTLTELKIPNPETFGDLVIERRSSARFRHLFTVPVGVEGGSGDPLEIVARAVDPAGNEGLSPPVLVDVLPDLEPPEVLFAAPAAGASFPGTVPIPVRVRALDNVDEETDLAASIEIEVSGEAVTGVRPAGDGAVEIDTRLPEVVSPIEVTARATDRAGNVGEAEPLRIDVLPNARPRVTAVAPGGGAGLPEGKRVSFTASATDDFAVTDLSLLRLQGLLGAVIGSVVPSEPGVGERAAFAVSELAERGPYSGLAVEVDGRRLELSREVLLPGSNLEVRIPAHGLELAEGASLRVEALLDDPAGAVDFLEDGIARNTGPGAAELVIPPRPSEGEALARLELAARDAAGAEVASWVRSIEVASRAEPEPSSLTLDFGSARLVLVTLPVPPKDQASISLPARLERLGDEDTVALVAVASDAAGLTGARLDAFRVLPDTTPPTVTLSGARSGDVAVGGTTLAVLARATDDAALARLDLFYRNANVESELGSGERLELPAELGVPTAAVGGTVRLFARAVDAAGNVAETAPVDLVVTPDQPPRARIVSLRNLNFGTISDLQQALATGGIFALEGTDLAVDVRADDDAGLDRVVVSLEPFAERPDGLPDLDALPDGAVVLLGEEDAGALSDGGAAVFPLANGSANRALVVRVAVRDGAGQVTTAETTVRVIADQAPAVALTTPVGDDLQDGIGLAAGTFRLLVEAVAIDDLEVASVQLLVNGAPLGAPVSLSTPVALLTADTGGEGFEVDADGLIVDDDGKHVPVDAQERAAIAAFAPPFDDPDRARVFGAVLELPVGLLQVGTPVRLGARATDNQGNTRLTEITLEVVPDGTPPLVQFTSPPLEFDVTEGSTLPVAVRAQDNVLVQQVEFFAAPSAGALESGRLFVARDLPAVDALPASAQTIETELQELVFPVPRLVADLGIADRDKVEYFLGARAVDRSGNASPIVALPIDIVLDRPPVVEIGQPASGEQVVEGTRIGVVLDVSDPDGAIASVDLRVNGELDPLGLNRVPPFDFSFLVPEGSAGQEFELEAVARDGFGNQALSNRVVVRSVANRNPSVNISAPVDGSVAFEGAPLLVSVEATDDIEPEGIAAVRFFVDGELVFTDLVRPFQYVRDLPFGAAGSRLVIGASAEDVKGLEQRAADVRVTVVADEEPPLLEIREPLPFAQVVEGATLAVRAEASDNVAVVSVAFALRVEDGAGGVVSEGVVEVDVDGPYGAFIPVPADAEGQLLIVSATATDVSGNTTTETVTVGVANDRRPTIRIVSPADGSTTVEGDPEGLLVTALGEDDVDIVSTEFLVATSPELDADGLLAAGEVAFVDYLLPFNLILRTSFGSAGEHRYLQARAVDTAGQQTLSNVVAVEITPDRPPTVAITDPLAGAVVFDGASLVIRSSARDDVEVAAVEFRVNGVVVDVTNAPLPEFDADDIYEGRLRIPVDSDGASFELVARAFDNAGQSTDSEPVVIGVVDDDVPPEVLIVDPPELELLTEGQPFQVRVRAFDQAGVGSADFLVDGERVFTSLLPALEGEVLLPGLGTTIFPYVHTLLAPVGMAGSELRLGASALDPSGNEGVAEEVRVELGLRTTGFDQFVSDTDVFLARAVEVSERLAYVLDGRISFVDPARLIVFEVASRPEDPVRLGQLDLEGDPRGVAIDGSFAYVVASGAEDRNGRVGPATLQVIDVGNPFAPELLTRVDLPGQVVHDVAVSGGLLLAAVDAFGLLVFDVSDPLAPQRVVLDRKLGLDRALGVAIEGTSAYLADGLGGLRLFDLATPDLTEIGAADTFGLAARVTLQGDLALVTDEGPGGALNVIDVRNPAEPVLLARRSAAPRRPDLLGAGAFGVAGVGSLALVTSDVSDQDGRSVKGLLDVVDVSDPGAPERLASANVPIPRFFEQDPELVWEVASLDDLALVAGGAAGLRVIRVPFTNVVDVDPADGALDVGVEGAITVTFSDQVDPDTIVDPADGTPTGNLLVVEAGTLGPGIVRLPVASLSGLDAGALTPGVAVPVHPAGSVQEIGTLVLDGAEAIFQLEARLIPDVLYELLEGGVTPLTAFRLPASELLGGRVEGRFAFDGPRVIFTPAEALRPGTSYRVLVRDGVDGVVDLAGMPLVAPFASLFTTVADPAAIAPVLLRVTPSAGSIEGGDTVVLEGAGFVEGARVSFGGADALAVRVVDAQTIEAVTPPNLPGPASVVVTNPLGLSDRRLGGYLYLELLRLSFVAPAVGLVEGGERVALVGGGFARGATVSFDGQPCESVRVESTRRVSCVTPPGDFGLADVRVANPPTVRQPSGARALLLDGFLYSRLSIASEVQSADPLEFLDSGGLLPSDELPLGTLSDVALDDGLAYLAIRGSAVRFSDLSLEGSLPIPPSAVAVVNVRQPESATRVSGGIDLPPPVAAEHLVLGPRHVYVIGRAQLGRTDNAFAVPGSAHLVVIDRGPLQDDVDGGSLRIEGEGPELGQYGGIVPFPGDALDLALAGDTLLVAAGSEGLHVFDVREPAAPTLLGTVREFLLGGSPVAGLAVVGVHAEAGLAFVTTEFRVGSRIENELLVLDLVAPLGTAPAPEGRTEVAGPTDTERGLAAVADGNLRVLDADPPDRIAPVSRLDPNLFDLQSRGAVSVDVVGNLAFLSLPVAPASCASGQRSHLEIADIADPERPGLVDGVALAPGTESGASAAEGDVAVVIARSCGLDGFNVRSNLTAIQVPAPNVAGLDLLSGAVRRRLEHREPGVPLDARFELRFSVEMDTASLDAGIALRRFADGAEQSLSIAPLADDPETRPDESLTRFELTPDAPLDAATEYELVLDDSVTGSGFALRAPYAARFTTATAPGGLPVIESVEPRIGSKAGGTELEIVVEGLGPGEPTVRIGGVAVPPADVEEADLGGGRTLLRARAPENLVGAAAVEVVASHGARDRRLGAFVYKEALSVATIAPATGPISGGIEIEITGEGFAPGGGLTVLFDDAPALDVRVLTTERIALRVPDGLLGVVDVTVANPPTADFPDGESVTIAGGFRFTVPLDARIGVGATGPIQDLVVESGLAFLADGGSFRIVRVDGTNPLLDDDPETPARENEIQPLERLGFVDTDFDAVDDRVLYVDEFAATAVAIDPGRDLVALGGGAIRLLDASDPRAPRLLRSLPVFYAEAAEPDPWQTATGLALDGDLLYAAAGTLGLLVADVVDPARALYVETIEFAAPVLDVAAWQRHLVVTTGRLDPDTAEPLPDSGAVYLLDRDAPATAPPVVLDVSAFRIALADGRAYLAAGIEGLVVVDLEAGVETGRLDLGAPALGVAVEGSIALLSTPRGTAYVRVDDPARPELLALGDRSSGEPGPVAVERGLVLTTGPAVFAGSALDVSRTPLLNVVSRRPEPGAVLPVEVDTTSTGDPIAPVRVGFNLQLDAATLGADTLEVRADGAPLAGAVAPDGSSVATFVPAGGAWPLDADVTVRALA
ncbi:MAG: Ig-like domain-containing protein, partial [Myxococcota bacterium]|nr:Ig-like domain-containing protein [Myxococcota bacterium]